MTPVQNQPTQFCASCGLPVTSDVNFCPRCGQPIQDIGASPQAPVAPPVSPPQIPAPLKSPKRKPGRSGCLGCSLVALVVFGFIVAIAYQGAREQQASLDATAKVRQYVEKRERTQQVAAKAATTKAAGLNAAGSYKVEYLVLAAQQYAFSATYTNGEGGIEQANHVFAHEDPTGEGGLTRAWIKNFSAPAGSHLYISAQNSDSRSNATLIVFISVDHKFVRQSEADGPYAMAQCSYTIPE
ncbi:MAG: zinc ribbon domain-containing protein [Abitibacteriaceae bacterium]|nr:zinc ribbon domain-containing protein [Abditibacteriaceae bacterium]